MFSQSPSCDTPVLVLYFPVGQGRPSHPPGVATPSVEEYVPAEHSCSSQSESCAAPMVVEYVPAGHFHWNGLLVPDGQNAPAGHGTLSQSANWETPSSVE